ncbi:MAG: helix-turn-helix domain-containing protein [Candidatus Cloacimonadota bacterium]|nr:MAG: helix-turn-helix domain-containing protein [Candidatus Cloacimonadota bacterium]
MFPRMYKIEPQIRIQVVQYYLGNGVTLMETAQKFNVNYRSVFKWVKWYKEEGEQRLLSTYKRPWNRAEKELEEKVVLLKENKPALTVRKAQEILGKEGIKISIKGIWGIWKRYVLAGRSKKDSYASFGQLTPEIKDSLKRIKELVNEGRVKEASGIVNVLPSFPKDPVLKEIPEELLTPRRQLDRLFFSFGEIPFPQFCRKAKKIRKALEKKGEFYSSISAGFMECLALSWMTAPEKQLELINLLKEKTEGIREPIFQFHLSFHEGIIHSKFLHFNEAKACLKQCIRLLRSLPYPIFFDCMASLLTNMTDHKNILFYYQKALETETDENDRKILLWKLSLTHAVAGRYRESIRLLRHAEKQMEGTRSSFAIVNAYCAFGRGDILRASSLFKSALEGSESGQLRNYLQAASLGLAEIQAALGNKKEAKIILHKYLSLLRKYRMEMEILIRNILLRKVLVNEQIQGFPMLYLFSLLQNGCKRGGYKKALRFAQDNGLLGFFHRIIVFFPEPVRDLLEKGKSTGLPKAILRLPVFNKEVPVYHIRFLGNLIVHKNQKRLAVKLQPKDRAFLIHLGIKAGEPEKEISLKSLYNNFWKKSKHPARNLSHLLVRIKKAVNLPSHLLEVSYKKDNPVLVNKGVHFITDYDEFQQSLAQAKALLCAGEWGFAKREYLRAFKLSRGEPFRKMYDDWSDDKRLEVIFSYEKEILSFVKELISRGRKKEAEKLLKKAEKIIPNSDLRMQTDSRRL